MDDYYESYSTRCMSGEENLCETKTCSCMQISPLQTIDDAQEKGKANTVWHQ